MGSGEQSAKSLRGARMEDVIFAGTKDRKAVGMAAVTMVLTSPPLPPAPNDTESNLTVIPSQPSDVTITRRLFRSGESEYLIDGRAARLRDIQDISHGFRPRTGKLRHHRAGQDWADLKFQAL